MPRCRWLATRAGLRAFTVFTITFTSGAIVLDDGAVQAALVAWKSLFVPDSVWAETSQRIAKETKIRPEYLLLSAVHDHGAPTLAPAQPTPAQFAYRATVQSAATEAVRRAKAQLQAARVGIGTSNASVNVNRREFSPGRGWWLGDNDEGSSDKTVTVLRFEDHDHRTREQLRRKQEDSDHSFG